MNSFKKSYKTTKPPPLSVVDSQPKTQRSSREKTKCKHTVSNPNYSTGLGWKWGKRGESSPFYRGNPKFSPPWPRVCAATGPRGRFTASSRARGRVTCVHVRPRGRADVRTHLRGRGASAHPRHVGAGAGPCPRGSVPAQTHLRVRADAVFTAFAGKRGCARTSGRTFSSKNVLYDIPVRKATSKEICEHRGERRHIPMTMTETSYKESRCLVQQPHEVHGVQFLDSRNWNHIIVSLHGRANNK
jgi:hypothetical protein